MKKLLFIGILAIVASNLFSQDVFKLNPFTGELDNTGSTTADSLDGLDLDSVAYIHKANTFEETNIFTPTQTFTGGATFSGEVTINDKVTINDTIDYAFTIDNANPDSVLTILNGGEISKTPTATVTSITTAQLQDTLINNPFDSLDFAGPIRYDEDVVCGDETWTHTGTAFDTVLISGALATDRYLWSFTIDPGSPGVGYYIAKEDSVIFGTDANVTGTPTYFWLRVKKY